MGAIIVNIDSNGNSIAPPVIGFESDVCAIDAYELEGTATARNGSVVVVYESPVFAESLPFGVAVVVDGTWKMRSDVPLGGRKFEAILIEIQLA